MDRNQLDGLIALKLVASKKNFSAAAEELNITAPAISKMIKQLERRLGVTLLSRTTRSTSLTEAGAQFLSEAGPALDHIIAAMQNVRTHAKKPAGLLRINLPRSIYPNYFSNIIESFKRKYPDIKIELYFEDHTSDVVEKGFDAGIRVSDIVAKDMVAKKLFGPIRFVVAGSPKYFKKNGYPKHPKDLQNHSCILPRFADSIYNRWEFEFKKSNFEVEISADMIVNDTLIMKEMACNGIGLIYVPQDLISDKVEAGKLEIVLDQYAAECDGYYLYYPTRAQVLPKLRVFLDHISENR